MAWLEASGDVRRAGVDRRSLLVPARPRSAFGAPAALVFGAGQIVAPAAVVGPFELGIDEAIDRLVADDAVPCLARQPPGDLLGRPAFAKAIEDGFAQGILTLQPGTAPAPGIGLLLRI